MSSRLAVFLSASAAGLLLCGLLLAQAIGPRHTLALVPLPASVRHLHGTFTLTPQTRICFEPAARDTAEYLAQQLRHSTGYPLPVIPSTSAAAAGNQSCILLTTNEAPATLGTEGYRLTVRPGSVTLRASQSAGLFYGVETFRELFPPQIFSGHPVAGIKWQAPCVDISDQPRFSWRGMLLDVSRHFFNKAEVERVLDSMAMHKLNVLHWHLVDDQGWRIEIKKYPRLTQVGAWRKRIGFDLDPETSTAYGPDGRYGGFYTQDDIREIVAYAQARHITIVPELEMPGHSSAALAAYPELSCSGGPYSTDPGESKSAGVYCAGKEETFEFLENVLSEIMELFPSKYIHIGGDEVPKENWHDCPRCQARMHSEGLANERQLESYFLRRINAFLTAHGRTMVGWSEIREGGLPPGAVLMDWIGGAAEAATNGHCVVRCPNEYCYFDYYQSRDRSHEPRAAGAYLPLSKAYEFEPIPPHLPVRYQSQILGGQGNLWTEYIPSLRSLEYMAFPRMCALAEVVWSPKATRDWDDFELRMHHHYERLEAAGINYRHPSRTSLP